MRIPAAGATLDAGALIAFERGDRRVAAFVQRATERKDILAVPAGVVAQVWRDGRRQSRLAHLLSSEVIEVVVLDDRAARAAGQLCGVAGVADVVDASVVLCARQRKHMVLTSDAEDLARLAPDLELVGV